MNSNQQNIRSVYAQNVHIGDVSAIVDFINFGDYSSIHVLVDENTKRCCLERFQQAVSAAMHIIEIRSGEEHKTLATCADVWQELLNQQADRKSLMINLGGGVIGDLGGFCAATFMRGMTFIQIPTTVLAMADASVGGKLGVDFQHKKNYVGIFQDPKMVWIDPNFLKTLSGRHIQNGMAEIIKHGLIEDLDLFELVTAAQRDDSFDWYDCLHRSVYIKSAIVNRDQFESGERKKLNFGHTIGHAIESAFLSRQLDLLHGEAIAIGMIAESRIAQQLGLLPDKSLDIIRERLLKFYPKVDLTQIEQNELIKLIQLDKKKAGDVVGFTLVDQIGHSIIEQLIPDETILESLNYYNNL